MTKPPIVMRSPWRVCPDSEGFLDIVALNGLVVATLASDEVTCEHIVELHNAWLHERWVDIGDSTVSPRFTLLLRDCLRERVRHDLSDGKG